VNIVWYCVKRCEVCDVRYNDIYSFRPGFEPLIKHRPCEPFFDTLNKQHSPIQQPHNHPHTSLTAARAAAARIFINTPYPTFS
jgi:hypothetical protein